MQTFATWDATNKGGTVTLTAGNLVATQNTNAEGWGGVTSTIGVSSGKWYWEYTFTTSGAAQFPDWQIGVAKNTAGLNAGFGDDLNGWVERTLTYKGNNNNYTIGYAASQPTQGNTIGVLLDMDGGTIALTNSAGVSLGTMFSGLSGTLFAGISVNGNGGTGCAITANFGATAFIYSVPSGYNSGLYTGSAGGGASRLQATGRLSASGRLQATGRLGAVGRISV